MPPVYDACNLFRNFTLASRMCTLRLDERIRLSSIRVAPNTEDGCGSDFRQTVTKYKTDNRLLRVVLRHFRYPVLGVEAFVDLT